jgi:hypothetical protein
MRQTMLTTKRKPATVGEVLVEQFTQPMALTPVALAAAPQRPVGDHEQSRRAQADRTHEASRRRLSC